MLLKLWYYLCLKDCKKLFVKKYILQNINVVSILFQITNAFDPANLYHHVNFVSSYINK